MTNAELYIQSKQEKKITARQKKSFLTAKIKQKKSENKRNGSSEQIRMEARRTQTHTHTKRTHQLGVLHGCVR
jgi:hypothetical protein